MGIRSAAWARGGVPLPGRHGETGDKIGTGRARPCRSPGPMWRPPRPAAAREDAADRGAPSAVAARGLPPWADQLACSVVGVSVRPSLRRRARGRTEDLRPEYLRAWGTIFMHRFNRLLRIYRTTARTRAELALETRGLKTLQKTVAMARGRGVSQGWALARTASRNPSASRKPPD